MQVLTCHFRGERDGGTPRAAAVLLAALVGIAVSGAHAHDLTGAPPPSQPAAAGEARVIEDPYDGTRFEAPRPGSYRLPVIKPAVDGDVLDMQGRRLRLFDVLGDRITLVSFVYTRCEDAKGCPLAVSVFYELEDMMAADPELGANLRLVSLSFDPGHDTPAVMAEYSGHHSLSANGKAPLWAFLTTASEAELQPILEGYGQYVVPERDPDGQLTGAFSHVLKVFLVDRERRVRNIYSASFLYPKLVISDVKTLLLEEAGRTN